MPTLHSSSSHTLNADRGLSVAGKVTYLLLNQAINLAGGCAVDPRLSQTRFEMPDLAGSLSQVNLDATPTRVLSDLFWLHLPWDAIIEELGAPHVLDVGCGTGRYAPLLDRVSGGRLGSYHGIDPFACDAWPGVAETVSGARFTVDRAEQAAQHIEEHTNLLISQSALEHVEGDLDYFAAVHEIVSRRTAPTLQIHLLPSAACLWCYRGHGVRQYTPRTLSLIARPFLDYSTVMLHALGDRASTRLLKKWFVPRDKRAGRQAEYEAQTRVALADDMARPVRSPSFYALVIYSHPRGPLPSLVGNQPLGRGC